MTDIVEKPHGTELMERNKFAEIRNKLTYIQKCLDNLHEEIKEAELADDINRKVEVDESVLLVGTAVSDVEHCDGYEVEEMPCRRWSVVIVIGITALIISLTYIAA
jgi:hypothetical protein